MDNLQGTLHFQMLQQSGSKHEEEENEDKEDRPEDVQEQGQSQKGLTLGHYEQHAQDLMPSSKSASKKPAIDNARYGKIVKVDGGHIVRSIARKDRHSKVYTCKGLRDRRFRLSAPTAIQFYDVQDRLGYDRPSKVIDWLIDKAKAAIEAQSESQLLGKEYDCTNYTNNQLHLQPHQGNNAEQETMNDVNSYKEPVLDPHHSSPVNYAEEAFNSASSLSDSKVMEMAQMGWFQSLMGWN